MDRLGRGLHLVGQSGNLGLNFVVIGRISRQGAAETGFAIKGVGGRCLKLVVKDHRRSQTGQRLILFILGRQHRRRSGDVRRIGFGRGQRQGRSLAPQAAQLFGSGFGGGRRGVQQRRRNRRCGGKGTALISGAQNHAVFLNLGFDAALNLALGDAVQHGGIRGGRLGAEIAVFGSQIAEVFCDRLHRREGLVKPLQRAGERPVGHRQNFTRSEHRMPPLDYSPRQIAPRPVRFHGQTAVI